MSELYAYADLKDLRKSELLDAAVKAGLKTFVKGEYVFVAFRDVDPDSVRPARRRIAVE